MTDLDATSIRAQVAELLGVDATTIDPRADLIQQGLDSIRMMQLAGRWRRDGVDVDFARMAARPSIAGWAELASATTPHQQADDTADQTPLDDDAPFPLAPMQHAMWVGRADDQPLGGVAGHLYVEFDGGPVDPDRLRAALAELTARHDMLRVEFLPDGTQRIRPVGFVIPLTVNDFRDLPAEQAAARLEQIRQAKSQQQLDGQVLELSVSLLDDEKTRLHIDLDMQAADAMSYRSITADLAALYRGESRSTLDYSYRRYRQHIQASPPPAYEQDRAWWTEQLPALPDPPALPVVPAPEQTDPTRSGRRSHWFATDERDALYAAAHRRGVTPAMTLAASFADTVSGWSTNPRFLLNVPMFGREQLHPDVTALVGDFTSSVLVDADLTDADSAAQRSLSMQNNFHRAAAHSSYEGLSVLRDLARHRGAQLLAPVVFTSALGLGELFAPEVTAEFGSPVWIISQGPQVLLDAQVTELSGGLLVNWDVREDAFRPGVIDAMFERHIAEVRALAADPASWDRPRAHLLPNAQREVRDADNATAAPPSGQRLHDGFFANVATQPEAVALYSSHGSLTYRELADQALALAAALRQAGVRPGDTVALVGPKTAQQVPALLGIFAAGAVYLPIGPDQPADRVARIIETGRVDLALVCGATVPELPVPVLTVEQALRTPADAAFRPVGTDPDSPAYVLFTSGSTGEPKGVELTHDAVMNTIEFINREFGLGPADRSLALATLESDMSVPDVFGLLAAGGAVVMVDEEFRLDPDHWAHLIAAHGVTFLNFMPGWLEMLVQVADRDRADRLGSLRTVLTGGDVVNTEMANRLNELVPGLRFAGLGGATETAIHHTVCEVATAPTHWASVPMGKPFPNIRCRVVNDRGDDCPDWVPGELWVGGRGIASGYRGREDLTRDRFVEHDGHRWYRTGDLARYWPDGTLEFIGRIDHRVKISGYRVELGEVEAALNRLPHVLGSAAAMVPAGDAGELLAALVRVDDSGPTVDEIRRGLAELVPPHMIPRHLELVDNLPYTVGGKADRPAVARLLRETADSGTAYRAPSGPVESAIAALTAEVLAAPRVGVDDDFFALGGDSVLATALVARIRNWLDTPTLLVADIFASRTVAALARLLSTRDNDSARLTQVAEIYLEVAAMDDDSVRTAISA